MSGFLATKEKWLISGDVMIDDRHDHLNAWIENTGKPALKLMTPYTQYHERNPKIIDFNWSDLIDNSLESLLKLD